MVTSQEAMVTSWNMRCSSQEWSNTGPHCTAKLWSLQPWRFQLLAGKLPEQHCLDVLLPRTWTWWSLEIPSNLNYSDSMNDHFLLKSSTMFMIPRVLGCLTAAPVEVTWYLPAHFCIISSSPSLRWVICSQKYVSPGKKLIPFSSDLELMLVSFWYWH